MSGIFGIVNFDGRPVQEQDLSPMLATLKRRGPDGSGIWIKGPVGLGHALMVTTPESCGDKQPVVDRTGMFSLTFAGRIDNRTELSAALEINSPPLNDLSDAELVMECYKRWGIGCLQHIVGDFALALWDGRNQQIFCARDVLGIKPFFYYFGKGTFRFASEIRPVIEHAPIQVRPNEKVVAEYLADTLRTVDETLYVDIYRLPPGCYLIVTRTGLRITRYWEVTGLKPIRYRTDDEYTEHFLTLFREAVNARLRTVGGVASELSGGIDSSSVVAMISQLQHEGNIPRSDFSTQSLIFPGLECDESDYIRAVIDRCGIKKHRAWRPTPYDYEWHRNQVKRYWDIPDYPNGAMAHQFREILGKEGVNVVLTGLGGDEWFAGSRYDYADLIRQGRLLSLFSKLRAEKDSLGSGTRDVLRYGIRPLIPERFIALLRSLKANSYESHYPWISRTLFDQSALSERLRQPPNWRMLPTYAQTEMFSRVTSIIQVHAIEMEERSAAELGLELRHPFQDRRIAEFGLALPEEQRRRNGIGKYVIRKAMQPLLPRLVLSRTSKAEFSAVFMEAIEAQGSRAFENMAIAEAGWINRDEAIRMYKRVKTEYASGDRDCCQYLWPLWRIYGMNIWYQEVLLDSRV